jgi:hypothetical protein
MKKTIRNFDLPNEIIKIANKDKEFRESWTDDRNVLDFPHPYRQRFSARLDWVKALSPRMYF